MYNEEYKNRNMSVGESMGVIFEFIGEIILEFIMEGSMSKNIPRPLRILCLLLMGIVYGGLIAFFIMGCFSGESRGFRILCGGTAVLLIVCLVGIYLRKRKKG